MRKINGRPFFRLFPFLMILVYMLMFSGSLQAKPWITAYVGDWWLGWNGEGTMPISKIDFKGMTVCDYMSMSPTMTAPFFDSTGNTYPATLLAAAANAAGVKCTITVGSWNTEAAFMNATDSVNLPVFVGDLTSFVKGCGLNGVDIDWEPLRVQDSTQWKSLIIALRKALPSPQYLITVTGGDGSPYSAYASVQDDVDQINIMTYDMGYPAGGYNACYAGAIYSAGHVDPYNNTTPVASCDYYLSLFEQAGIKKSKLGIGCEPGGELWTGISQPYSSIAGVKSFQADVPYDTIMARYYKPSLYHWDNAAKAAYLSFDTTDTADDWFLSYDDTTTLNAKLAFVDSSGIGGIIIYEIGMSYDQATGGNPFLEAAQMFLSDTSTAAIDNTPPVPSRYSLAQNYPNPFNPTTVINYRIPDEKHVTLTIYDALGRRIETLVNGMQSPGLHQVIFDGSNLASGVYFYRLDAGGFIETKKLVLLK